MRSSMDVIKELGRVVNSRYVARQNCGTYYSDLPSIEENNYSREPGPPSEQSSGT
jgi:hypothetical protein